MPASSTHIVTRHPLADGGAPDWASGWGEDGRGPFVEVSVGDVTQRLRWIPPGRFRMGSPADEPGRFAERESPRHLVAISQGFWLYDTPCTQAMWEAVMGENPSKFKSPTRPVENISWDDCQQFLARLQGLVPDLVVNLPTEAEWEHACRAGTTAAAYAGPIEILGEHHAPVLDAIAWYGGNAGVGYDLDHGVSASNWSAKQHEFDKCGTRVVATKGPNAWGLYDMLGNVWEWCRDGQRTYTDHEETDPVGTDDASAGRVVRGGSWFSLARNVRAACRNSYLPGDRRINLGFRCRVQ